MPVVLGLALGGTACTSNSNRPIYTSRTEQVPASSAFVVPPPGGPAIIAVLETRFSNAVQQEIALRTNATNEGQNAILVKIFGPVGGSFDPTERFTPTLPSASRLHAEMRQSLPGVAMTVSPYFAQNTYGPFGYAVGRTVSGALCIYGWQKIAPDTPRPLFAPTRGAVDMRLRVCDRTASEDELLNLMYGLVVIGTVSAYGWNPFGKPPPASTDIGRAGYPISPANWSYARPVAPATAVAVQPAPPAPATAAGTPEKPPAAAAAATSDYPDIPAPDPGTAGSVPAKPASPASEVTADGDGEPTVLVPPPAQ